MILHSLHSLIRYVVLLSGVAVILYATVGAVRGRPHDRTMKNLAITFRTALVGNVALGLTMVMTAFGFRPDLGVHVILMLFATAVAHLVPAVMRRRPQSERTLLPYAVATAVSLALVAAAIVSLGRPIVF